LLSIGAKPLKYLVKPATNAEGTLGWGVCTRTKGLYWYETEGEARLDAVVLEAKHLQAQMDKCLETIGKLDPTCRPEDYLA